MVGRKDHAIFEEDKVADDELDISDMIPDVRIKESNFKSCLKILIMT